MRLLNLFDGLGGFGLAAKWMGWDNVASCEIDPYCRRVLDYWFDYKYIYDDITTTDFTPLRGNIDLVTGGFPCQPFSLAGKQLGENDSRYLWPHMLRAVREVRPRWVVAENVRGLITLAGGVVFEQVCAGLESAGYEVQPFVLPAAGVGAPHRRDRLWIVAHASDAGAESEQGREDGLRGPFPSSDTERGGGHEIRNEIQSGQSDGKRPDRVGGKRDASDADGDRQRDGALQHEYRQECEAAADNRHDGTDGITSDGKGAGLQSVIDGQRKVESRRNVTGCERLRFDRFPSQSPVCRGDDGLSGRLVGITFPKWREQAIKMFGNSVVPQVVYQIYKAIEEYERITTQDS